MFLNGWSEWSVVSGQWTVDSGQWTVDSGQFKVFNLKVECPAEASPEVFEESIQDLICM